MSFNLSISDVPTHVVVWQDKDSNSALIKSLTERITSLEATVMNLLKKETPLLSGLDVRRGIPPLNIAQETDSRGLFKELIEKPQPLPGNMYEMTSEAIKFVDILPTHEFGNDADEQDEDVDVEETEGTEETEEVKVEVKKDEQPNEAEDVEEQEQEQEQEEEAEVEVEAEQDQEQEQEDEGEAEQEEEAEVEEQALELTEFEYKGVTYFRDPENQVYQVDSDGDLDDTPIGLWSEEKQKVLRFRSA
jgi:hypothetical protein